MAIAYIKSSHSLLQHNKLEKCYSFFFSVVERSCVNLFRHCRELHLNWDDVVSRLWSDSFEEFCMLPLKTKRLVTSLNASSSCLLVTKFIFYAVWARTRTLYYCYEMFLFRTDEVEP